jgi:tetratricopeptide (TPR) repeat protein
MVAAVLASLMLTSAGAAQQSPRTNIERLIHANHLEEAERHLWTTLQTHPNEVWALDLLGTVRQKQKHNPEAQALFQRAYSLNPRDVLALRGLGDGARSAGSIDDAIGWYTKLLAIAPGDLPARKWLSILHEKKGRYQESVSMINAIPVASRTPDLLPVLASDYLGLHQEDKVGPLIAKILSRQAGLEVTLDFVAVLIRNGYLKDADKILQALHPAHASADYLHVLARVREAQERIPEAASLLQRALQAEPKSFDLLFDSARFAAQHERWDDAVNLLQRANMVSPDRPEVLLKLTLALLKSRRRERAVAVAKRLNAIAPDDPDAQYILAFALVENEQWEMAEPIALKAVQSRPADANTQLLIGIVHLSKGDLQPARESLDKSLAIDPNLQDAHYYSALVSERAGNFDAARQELDAVVKKAPNHAGAHAELGVLDLRAGNVEQARSALETAVKLQPEVAQSHYQLGLVYSRLGLQEQAQAEMAQFKKLRDSEDALRRHEAGLRTP